jgi:hypothetical protein
MPDIAAPRCYDAVVAEEKNSELSPQEVTSGLRGF